MPALNELYVLTAQMIDEFENAEQNKREDLVKSFEFFVNERDRLIKEVSEPYSDKEVEIGKELLKKDQRLKELVDRYFSGFKEDLSQLNKKRQSNQKYMNPYKNLYGSDGNFIDKKN